nr:AC5 [Mungbean yellow mosaic India virus]
MVFILRCLLVVVNNIIINFEKTIHHGLFLTSIMATSNSGIKFSQDRITITQIVLHSSCTWLGGRHATKSSSPPGCA